CDAYAVLSLCYRWQYYRTVRAQENITVVEEPMQAFECFHQPAESCPESGCKLLDSSNDTAICCNMKKAFVLKEEVTGKLAVSSSHLKLPQVNPNFSFL
ncbi:hypothetical protein L9F63_000315, partial [Diploptera punctata]